MKNIITYLSIGMLISATPLQANSHLKNPEDTVVIELGENSKIVIYAETQEDLKAISEYDINAMLDALNSSLDSASADVSELSISDDSGLKYKIDTAGGGSYVDRQSLKYYGDDNYDNDEYRYEPDQDHWRYDDDDDDDDEYISQNKKGRRRTYSSFDIELGMNNWLEGSSFPDATNQPYSIKPWGSWYVGLGGTNHTPVAGALSLNWGGNITWYTWKMEDTSVRIEKTDTETTFTPDVSVNSVKSKLAATYINAMLVPMLDFSHKRNSTDGRHGHGSKYNRKGFRIGAGMYAGYRINSWTKYVYKDEGDKRKDKKTENYFLNNFRYGIRAQMGFKGMDLFFNYDLNTVFAEGGGPELNAISFGFIL